MTFSNIHISNIIYNNKTVRIYSIILSIISLIIISSIYYLFSSNNSIRLFIKEYKSFNFQIKSTTLPSILFLPTLLINLTFTINTIYHHNGIAYDYYSQYELRQTNINNLWKNWSLPNEINHRYFIEDIQISPYIISKLPFIDHIYVMTDPRLTERHKNLEKALFNQGISIESIKWRIKWNYTTCNSHSNHQYVYQRLNLKEKYLNKQQQRTCALAMKHVDVWYEMAEQKVNLGLILEDDAIFVPFFKEKFTRMIYAAINKRILHLNDTCVKDIDKPISDDEWINQNPMIVIGTCYHMYGKSFQSQILNPSPDFSTHKSSASRCTHAYLLTLCSAQALIDQIHRQKNDFLPSDFMINYLFNLSSTLQSFWIDPPLSYQGNQVIDLDNIETFKKQTYK